MAISTPTSVSTENVSTDGTSATTTGSWTPVPGRLYLFVIGVTSGSAAVPDGTLTHAGGETLTKMATANLVMENGAIANGQRLTLWYCVAVGSTAGTLTWTGGGGSMNGFEFMITEIASGFNAVAPIPQGATTASVGDTDGDFDVTLGTFVDANSITMGAAMHAGASTAFTVPTGWTAVHAPTTAAPTGKYSVAYIMGNDLVADWTSAIASGEDIGGIGWEVAAAVASGLVGDEGAWLPPVPAFPTVGFW